MERQGIKRPLGKFGSPWAYFNVPAEDMDELLRLFCNLYLSPANPTLPKAIQQVMYPDSFIQANMQWRDMASHDAIEAAKWFVIADFIGQKYERYHPTFTMRDVPEGVLHYLRPPYNGMKKLGFTDQKAYRNSLPDNQKREVYLDD